jgi:hypothetical protein
VSRQTDAGTLYADVINAKLHLGGSLFQAFREFDIDAVLTLECSPDWYGDEVDLGDNSTTTLPELIFTDTGMESYSFRLDPAMGFPIGVAALESGDLLVLARRDGLTHVVRCSFRGELVGELALTGVPSDFAARFTPNAIRRAGGKTYLADYNTMKVLVVGDAGEHLASIDLAGMLDLESSRDDGLTGFSVARDGSLLFTIATQFHAYVVAPDGSVRSWGKSGGAPGRFNVVKGIVADDRGRFYVLDGLKSAVIAFDSALNFIGEFGYFGAAPGSLIFPTSIAFGDGRIYVAQSADRGVAVFNIID